ATRSKWRMLPRMMARSRARAVLTASVALWVIGATARPVAAQVMTGTVYGSITDAQGGVIPGATLILISDTRGTKSAPVVTNANGDYVFPNVAADTYTLEASMSGFKTVKRPGLAVSPGDRVAVPTLALEVGGTSETVTVIAERPLMQAQSGERSFTVIPEEVQNLPIFDRTFRALAGLAPGMSHTAPPTPPHLA